MIKALREKFNNNFTEEKYEALLASLDLLYPGALDFRVAETPVFIPKDFTKKMLATCENIIDIIISPNFLARTERSIPSGQFVPGENEFCPFMVFDFGVCEGQGGEAEPQLIEMQGFPTLFAYQAYLSDLERPYAGVPDNFSSYLGGYDRNSYVQLLKEIILGVHTPEGVILLEIFPEKQKTRIDFYCTEKLVGLQTVCFTKLIAEDGKLFYLKDGRKIRITRIYNRMIFDDLLQQEGLENTIDLSKEYEVEWIPHPHWFYRISKFTLPFIDDPHVPETFFLNELKTPLPLEEYVLKPLFSFAGMGVIIDVKQSDIDDIKDPENWILQKKVYYAPVIKTPDDPAKAEIRLFYFWKKDWDRPRAVHNLARLSKGKMIGTRYNKDKTWVGGTIAYFESE